MLLTKILQNCNSCLGQSLWCLLHMPLFHATQNFCPPFAICANDVASLALFLCLFARGASASGDRSCLAPSPVRPDAHVISAFARVRVSASSCGYPDLIKLTTKPLVKTSFSRIHKSIPLPALSRQGGSQGMIDMIQIHIQRGEVNPGFARSCSPPQNCQPSLQRSPTHARNNNMRRCLLRPRLAPPQQLWRSLPARGASAPRSACSLGR